MRGSDHPSPVTWPSPPHHNTTGALSSGDTQSHCHLSNLTWHLQPYSAGTCFFSHCPPQLIPAPIRLPTLGVTSGLEPRKRSPSIIITGDLSHLSRLPPHSYLLPLAPQTGSSQLGGQSQTCRHPPHSHCNHPPWSCGLHTHPPQLAGSFPGSVVPPTCSHSLRFCGISPTCRQPLRSCIVPHPSLLQPAGYSKPVVSCGSGVLPSGEWALTRGGEGSQSTHLPTTTSTPNITGACSGNAQYCGSLSIQVTFALTSAQHLCCPHCSQ